MVTEDQLVEIFSDVSIFVLDQNTPLPYPSMPNQQNGSN
jgi:hypothetical protein